MTITEIKQQLLKDVSYLTSCNSQRWTFPIASFLNVIKHEKIRAVLFGGALKSLALNRNNKQKQIGRPRDLDIVVYQDYIEFFKLYFRDCEQRETRFGGLQIKKDGWSYDIWPLQNTWAFKNNKSLIPSFENLPKTTFFNIESVAVDLWTNPGLKRKIYSNDDIFFKGIINKQLEINMEENPFPSLCVLRSLNIIEKTKFSIGPKLKKYIKQHGSNISALEFSTVQKKHYGSEIFSYDQLKSFINGK